MLKLRNIHKQYSDRTVLNGIDLDAKKKVKSSPLLDQVELEKRLYSEPLIYLKSRLREK